MSPTLYGVPPSVRKRCVMWKGDFRDVAGQLTAAVDWSGLATAGARRPKAVRSPVAAVTPASRTIRPRSPDVPHHHRGDRRPRDAQLSLS